MRDIEVELAKAEKEVYGKVCRSCNRPIENRLTVANRDAKGYPECNECSGTVSLPDYGCYVWISDGALFNVEGNDYEEYGAADEVIGEVTAPESQDFLDAVNEALGSDFRLDQFAGR